MPHLAQIVESVYRAHRQNNPTEANDDAPNPNDGTPEQTRLQSKRPVSAAGEVWDGNRLNSPLPSSSLSVSHSPKQKSSRANVEAIDPQAADVLRTDSGFRGAWSYRDPEEEPSPSVDDSRGLWRRWVEIPLGLAPSGSGEQPQEDGRVDSPQTEHGELGPRTASPERHEQEPPQNTPSEGPNGAQQHQDSGAGSPSRQGSIGLWPLPDPLKSLGLTRTQSMPQIGSRKNSRQDTLESHAENGEAAHVAATQRWNVLKQRIRVSSTAGGLPPLRRKRQSLFAQSSMAAQVDLNEELLAGPLALQILRMWFARDENGRRRVPVLLQHLKIRVSDSVHPLHGTHAVFRIECKYGDRGAAWVIYRELRDFLSIHAYYRVLYTAGGDGLLIPEFPRSGIPLFNILKKEAREKGNPGGRAEFARQQREALENYLIGLIKAVMFRPEANRLCKWFEISALSVALAFRGGIQGKAGLLQELSSKSPHKAPHPINFPSWNRHETQTWWLVRESYLVSVADPADLIIDDVFLLDVDFRIERPKRVYRQGLNLLRVGGGGKESEMHDWDLPKSASSSSSSSSLNSNDTNHQVIIDPSIGQDPRKVGTKEEDDANGLGGAKGKKKKQPTDVSQHMFYITNGQRRLKFLAKNERQMLQFIASMERVAGQSHWTGVNRFESFAPIRLNVNAQWLVDGRDYFWNLSRAIMLAKERIYIHDWWLSPELYLRGPGQEDYRLDRLLKRKAEEGVKIYVILYKEVSDRTTPTDNNYAKRKLMALHPNIMVQRAPANTPTSTFYWAHHEKMCVIDEAIAFMGGLDLCFGRWDTPRHILVDDGNVESPEGSTQIGQDYSNVRVTDFHTLNKPHEGIFDRTKGARMSWHDVGIQIVGQPARDLCRHFVQRWNYLLQTKAHSCVMPFLLPPPDFKITELNDQGLTGTCEIQICRSAGPWSLGTATRIEHSIQNAYVKAIQLSEHFVYIENQFFITSTVINDIPVENNIGDALVHRIIRAHRENTPWRACIVIPLLPGFTFPIDHNDANSIRIIVELQNRSICRGPNSIFSRLRNEGIEPRDYISFFSLRGWGRLKNNTLTTEQVYVHSKIMIVDDRLVIIGSANINERSMRGDRDSELACVVRDTDMIQSRMAGKPFKVGRFAHTLRIRLMREHVGIDTDAMYEADLMATYAKDVESWGLDYEQVKGKMEGITTVKHRGTMEQYSVFARDVGEQELLGLSEATANFADKGAEQGLLDTAVPSPKGKDKEKKVYGSDGPQQPSVASSKVPTLEEKAVAEHFRKKLEEGEDKSLMDATDEGQDDKVLPSQAESSASECSTDAARQESRKHLAGMLNILPTPKLETDPHCFGDPLDPRFWKDVWCATAVHNTEIYRKVFHCTPDDFVTTWRMYKECLLFQKRANKPSEALLKGVKGHLVVFPTRFLEEEDTANNFLFTSDRLLPMPVFN